MNVTAHQMKHTECMLNQVLPAGNPSLCTEESLTQAVAGCVKTIREALQRTPGLACVDVRRLPEAERRAIARLRRKWERCLGEYEERVNARTLWSASRRNTGVRTRGAEECRLRGLRSVPQLGNQPKLPVQGASNLHRL